MATPPTRVVGVTPAVGWNSSASPKTSPTFDVMSGDLIVLLAFTEDAGCTLATPTWTGTGTWTLRQSIVVSSYCTAYLYTCPVTATATGRTISQATAVGTLTWSFYASVWRNHGGLGVTGKTNVASGAPALTLATAANSAVICGNSDWSATSPTGHVWRTVNGSPMTETSQGGSAGASYETYTGYAPDTGAPGSTVVGLTSPSQKYSIVGAEVLGLASSTPVTTGTTGVSVGLAGAATVLAVAAGSLALGLALSGTAVPVAVATGTLPVVAALTGTASSAATVTGALPASVALTGTASQTGTYTATGSLPAALSLTGTASMVATVTGSLPLTAGLSGAGSVIGSYVVTGNLPLTVGLAGTGQTITTVTGALPVAVGLTGSANVPAVPALTGTLPAAVSLTGAANIVALTTGTLPLTISVSGVGVNPSNEHDVTVTAALDTRPWASALTTRTNTGTLVQRSWEARLE